MIMKLKAEPRAQGGCRASEKKNACQIYFPGSFVNIQEQKFLQKKPFAPYDIPAARTRHCLGLVVPFPFLLLQSLYSVKCNEGNIWYPFLSSLKISHHQIFRNAENSMIKL
jgi:hypothetical protein